MLNFVNILFQNGTMGSQKQVKIHSKSFKKIPIFFRIHIAKDNIEKENNIKTAKKNIVHCFRYLLLASQLIIHVSFLNFHRNIINLIFSFFQNKIIDFGVANKYWYEIKDKEIIDWEYYLGIYESLKSSFEKLTEKLQFYNKIEVYRNDFVQIWKSQGNFSGITKKVGTSKLKTLEYVEVNGLDSLMSNKGISIFRSPKHPHLLILTKSVS